MDYAMITKILNSDRASAELRTYMSTHNASNQTEALALRILSYLTFDFYLQNPDQIPLASIKPKDCTEALWQDLEPLYACKVPIEIAVKLHDFAWLFYKKYDHAKEAFYGYLSLMEKRSPDSLTVTYFCRCISISKSLKNDDLKNAIASKTDRILDQYIQADQSPYSLFRLCFECSVMTPQEILRMCAKFEQASTAIHPEYYQLKIKILEQSKPANHKKEIQKARRALVDWYCSMGNTANTFGAIQFLKSALKELRQIPNTQEEREKINHQLSELQKQSMEQLHSHSYQIDVAMEREIVRRSTDTTDVHRLICVLVCLTNIPKYETMKDEVLKIHRDHGIFTLFNKQILNERGKTIAHLPTLSRTDPEADIKSLEIHMCSHLIEHYNHTASIMLYPVLKKIQSLSADYLTICEDIVSDCFFVPEDRKKSFAKGLAAGFEGDYITALSILAPQFENAWRVFAESLGGVIYSIEADECERARTMDDIINLPQIVDCVHKDILLNTKALFLSRCSGNMRNDIGHGLLSDSAFDTPIALYTWAFILKLCYLWQGFHQAKWSMYEEELKKTNAICEELKENSET